MKLVIANLCAVLLVLFGGGVFAAPTVYTEDKTNVVVDSNHPEFTIKLKSNPTTGYSWYIREYNHNLVSPMKHIFQASNNKLIGAPGYELWTFRVKPEAFIVPHQLVLRFTYTRPWEGTVENPSQIVFRVMTSK